MVTFFDSLLRILSLLFQSPIVYVPCCIGLVCSLFALVMRLVRGRYA